MSQPAMRDTPNILSLQKELEAKQHELTIAYQTSLELIETNNDIQQQLEQQSITIQTLDAKIIDYEMKIDLLEAENMEYQQTIHQTNDKYEETLGELAVTRQHSNNALNEIKQYQETMQSLNHNIINNKPNNYNENKLYMEKQQKKYDELLKECKKYRNDRSLLIEQEIDLENMKKDMVKMKKRNKLLSDQIVELMNNNVHLEKEISDCSMEINEHTQTIQFLQTENQSLMTKPLSIASCHKRLHSYVFNTSTYNNKSNSDLKRLLSVQLRHNFSDNSKLVMLAKDIGDDAMDEVDGTEEEQDLFTMVQNYENNEEYFELGTMDDEDISEQDSVLSLESDSDKMLQLLCQLGILLLWFESYLIMFPTAILTI